MNPETKISEVGQRSWYSDDELELIRIAQFDLLVRGLRLMVTK